MDFKTAKDATLIDEEQKKGLIPNLTTQDELNEFEAENIAAAILWAKSSRRLKEDYLEVSGVLLLHKKMFEKTWKWAGDLRLIETNIGISYKNIQENLKILLDDVKYWIQKNTYSIDEIAIRFHHRLVQIHVFPNGNGRHARIMADLLLQYCGATKFSWGAANLVQGGEPKDRYVAALRKMDKDRDDVGDLLEFARS